MFVNRMPRYDVLSEEAMAILEDGWRRLVSEIGIRFDCERAQARFRAAGQDVGEEGVVRFDPDFLLEQVAKAPGAFPPKASCRGTGTAAWPRERTPVPGASTSASPSRPTTRSACRIPRRDRR